MSIVFRTADEEEVDTDLFELYSILGERDTARLYDEKYDIDVSHDIPWGAGNSVDRRTKYIDRELFAATMDGDFAKSGLDPMQIIGRWLDHEHTEKCIVDGDNPIDTYFPGHRRALVKEHEGVLAILGHDGAKEKIENYESGIWPGLVRCYKKVPKVVPADLWCGPILDNLEDEHDQEIIDRLISLRILDAGKKSKHETRYGYGKHDCEVCTHFNVRPLKKPQEGNDIAPCEMVAGLVRVDRNCDLWKPKSSSVQAAQILKAS
jgi:hypothetical protein